MSTIAQVDQALLTTCTAYADCLDHGDLDGADQAYAPVGRAARGAPAPTAAPSAVVITDAEVRAITATIVNQTCRRNPQPPQSVEEIRSDAMLGIAKAIAAHDPSKGVPLAAYAYLRARGEVMDGIRSRAPVGRYAHAQGRTVDDLLPQQRPPISIELLTSTSDVPDPHATEALAHVDDALTAPWLLEQLNPQQRAAVIGYYWRGLTCKQIGVELGVTESRVSQLLKRAAQVLRPCVDAA
ncbi:MAG: polymerase, sigma 28 subunit, SigD/FliA/WhiG [Frankiales bacterium]|nr:polymerase, sigma 28 subunit, SigD/FliA/WhiG [Frankiales bacterium]